MKGTAGRLLVKCCLQCRCYFDKLPKEKYTLFTVLSVTDGVNSYFVTANHCLQELKKNEKEYGNSSIEIGNAHLKASTVDFLRLGWYQVPELARKGGDAYKDFLEFDVAIAQVDQSLLEHLVSRGLQSAPITPADTWDCVSHIEFDKDDEILLWLCGYPEYLNIHLENEPHDTTLLCIPLHRTKPEYDGDFLLKFKINTSDLSVPSHGIKGMSGGVAYISIGEKEFLLGIQSSQIPSGSKIEFVKVASATLLPAIIKNMSIQG